MNRLKAFGGESSLPVIEVCLCESLVVTFAVAVPYTQTNLIRAARLNNLIMSPGPPPTISTGPTPTEVTTAPSPSVSTIQQTEIPASTVIAIGLGFVALTTCGLLGLIGFRVLKVYMVVRRRRRNGEPDVQFRREWRRVGGMFGFMSGFNNGAGDSALIVGAGGVEMRRRLELLMLRENMQAANKPEMVEPTFWDTRIGSDLGGGEVEKMERWGVSVVVDLSSLIYGGWSLCKCKSGRMADW